MNNVTLIVAVLALGACATSSTPSGGGDAGPPFDATVLDVPAFDVSAPTDAGRDTMAPLFDAGPRRPDTGTRDAGPPRLDAGPPERDAGRPDSSLPDGGFCLPDGLYEAIPSPSNPAICESAGIDLCRVASAGSSARYTCGEVNGACTLATDACTCSGSTEFAGIVIDVFADFDRQQITFSAAGQSCSFRLSPR